MPTQDNCEDLNVESCVDENGQTIIGGDSYSVPTGRYVKHVVNVCGSGGGGSAMKVCAGGGLELVGSGENQCMQIITEDDSALVLDNGILKIDSTKIKVTSDNVFPAGTDPGLVSALPVFTDPDGNVWNNQSDYNKWLYEDQKRQDQEIEDLKNSSSGGGEKMVFWGIMPKDAPLGALWTDQDTLKQYVHTGDGTWAQVAQCAGGEIIKENQTYIEYTKYAYGMGAVNHNGESITGGQVDIWWDSTEGKDYYDGDYYWEVDMLGDDTWVKHEDLPQEFLDKINYRWQNNSRYGYEAAVDNTFSHIQHPDYPCARIRITCSNYSHVDDKDFAILTSEPTPMFPNANYSGKEPPTADKYFPVCNP